MLRVVVVVLLVGSSTLWARESAWLGDLERAKERARKENRPIFVVFRCEH